MLNNNSNNDHPDAYSSPFFELKKMILEYVEARIQLIKLDVVEKAAKVTAALFSSLIISLLAFFLLFFLSVSASFYLGEVMHSNALGFLTVAGFYLIIFAVALVKKKVLFEKIILDRIIEDLTKKDGDEKPE